MATYIPKRRSDILNNALQKVQNDTGIKSVGVGSVARSYIEAVTSELADMYDLLDYNISQTRISTASGQHLDAIGRTYGVERATISNAAEISRTTGSFFFYISSPHNQAISIPIGTNVYTSTANFVGKQLSYTTTSETVIPVGETRAYASIKVNFSDGEYTAGPNTITVTDATSRASGNDAVTILCTNPKAIHSQKGYESDNNFRSRIIKRTQVAATGNESAVRYALLGQSGVRDVKIFSGRLGLGVMEVVIVPDDIGFSSDQIGVLRALVNQHKPAGVRAILTQPTKLTTEIVAIITVKTGLSDTTDYTTRIAGRWRNYLNNLLPGQPLVYNKLIDIGFSVSDKVFDVQITELRVSSRSITRGVYTPEPDQLIVPGNIDVSSVSFT